MKLLLSPRWFPSACAGLLLAAAGCGDPDGIGDTLPVSGRVIIDKTAAPTGVVTFIPDESRGNHLKAAAVGTVVQGEFSLTTQSASGSRPGAPAGWYKVTVATVAPPGAATPAGTRPMRGPAVAPRYATSATTPILVEVKENGTYDLKVTSR
jgi:hypothetical protein